jgi:F-type H+-transporting ATPase subunit alpha
LQRDLFFSGVRPAVNVGISVSRVGGDAQIKAMKQVAGTLRLDLASYRELEAFAQFGSELDPDTQATLSRGARLVKTLNQPQYDPWPVGEQVAIIWSATNGHLDEVAVDDVERFNSELRERVGSTGMGTRIEEAGALDDTIIAELGKLVGEFASDFVPSSEKVGATA